MSFKSAILAVVVLVCAGSAAQAFENFIPLGTGYSTDTSSLPELNSSKDRVNLQSDIYETEIYMKERDEKVQESYLNRFVSNTETSGGDYSIDY